LYNVEQVAAYPAIFVLEEIGHAAPEVNIRISRTSQSEGIIPSNTFDVGHRLLGARFWTFSEQPQYDEWKTSGPQWQKEVISEGL